MTEKNCAYCGLAEPDTEFKYTYEAKRTIPHVLPSGKITIKEWTKETRRLEIEVPVHRTRKRRADRIAGIVMGPFLLSLLGFHQPVCDWGNPGTE
jgi:hypothetical protein